MSRARAGGVEPIWPINRAAYWNGETVAALDFNDEQQFHDVDLAWRMALLRVAGLSDGFLLNLPAPSTATVTVSAGSGYDLDGRLLAVAPMRLGASTPLPPLIAGEPGPTRSAWHGAIDGTWQREFTPEELAGAGEVKLYIAYGESSTSDPLGLTVPNRWQQTPVIDIVPAGTALPAGALLLGTLTAAAGAFTSISLDGRPWSGVLLPTPTLPATRAPSEPLSSSAAATNDVPVGGEACFYARSAPIVYGDAAMLQIAGAGAIMIGTQTVSPSPRVDPALPHLRIDSDGNAIVTSPTVTVDAGHDVVTPALRVGPPLAPRLVAATGSVTVNGTFSVGTAGVKWLDVQATSVALTLPIGSGADTVWSSTADAPAGMTLPNGLYMIDAQRLCVGSAPDTDDALFARADPDLGDHALAVSAVSAVALVAAGAPLITVAGTCGLPALVFLVPTALTGTNALAVAAGATVELQADLALPLTHEIASEMWRNTALDDGVLNTWYSDGSDSRTGAVNFNSNGGSLLVTLGGLVPLPAPPSTVSVVRFRLLLDNLPLAELDAPYASSMAELKSNGVWLVPTTQVWALDLAKGEHNLVVILLGQTVTSAGSALVGSVAEQPLALEL